MMHCSVKRWINESVLYLYCSSDHCQVFLPSQTFETLQILAYAERRFRIYSTIICNSDNQYNTTILITAFDNLTVFVFYRLVMARGKNQTETYRLFNQS